MTNLCGRIPKIYVVFHSKEGRASSLHLNVTCTSDFRKSLKCGERRRNCKFEKSDKHHIRQMNNHVDST